jgi:hypothetical protein
MVGILVAEDAGPTNRVGQPSTMKWYLSPDYLEDPEHGETIARAQARAAKLDEAGIERLVEAATRSQRDIDDYWTLVVLERAVPAMVGALSKPAFQELTAPYSQASDFKSASRLEALWELLEPFAPETAVPGLAKLGRHPERAVRREAIIALGSIGKPSCAPPLQTALRSDDANDRTYALMGISRAIAHGRAVPQFLESLFDDVANAIELKSSGGTQAPSVLLKMDRGRAVARLLMPERFRATHREIDSIVSALADANVIVNPAECVVNLLDELERQRRVQTTAFGYGLKLLALTRRSSAGPRIELAMAFDAPGDELRSKFHRQLAADAYLALNGIGEAYHVAIDAWGGPGELERLPEPLRNYATVHVLNNEVCNG